MTPACHPAAGLAQNLSGREITATVKPVRELTVFCGGGSPDQTYRQHNEGAIMLAAPLFAGPSSSSLSAQEPIGETGEVRIAAAQQVHRCHHSTVSVR